MVFDPGLPSSVSAEFSDEAAYGRCRGARSVFPFVASLLRIILDLSPAPVPLIRARSAYDAMSGPPLTSEDQGGGVHDTIARAG